MSRQFHQTRTGCWQVGHPWRSWLCSLSTRSLLDQRPQLEPINFISFYHWVHKTQRSLTYLAYHISNLSCLWYFERVHITCKIWSKYLFVPALNICIVKCTFKYYPQSIISRVDCVNKDWSSFKAFINEKLQFHSSKRWMCPFTQD